MFEAGVLGHVADLARAERHGRLIWAQMGTNLVHLRKVRVQVSMLVAHLQHLDLEAGPLQLVAHERLQIGPLTPEGPAVLDQQDG